MFPVVKELPPKLLLAIRELCGLIICGCDNEDDEEVCFDCCASDGAPPLLRLLSELTGTVLPTPLAVFVFVEEAMF